MTIAKRLKMAMKAKGWDPDDGRDLAEATGIHITLVRRYLSSEVDVGAKNARTIAKALGLSLESVLYSV